MPAVVVFKYSAKLMVLSVGNSTPLFIPQIKKKNLLLLRIFQTSDMTTCVSILYTISGRLRKVIIDLMVINLYSKF